MNIIILAFLNSVIWTLLTIRWKTLRQNDVSSVSSFGMICAGLPLWIITFIFLYHQNNFVFSGKYILNLSIWSVLCIATGLGGLYIIKFKALSELGIYRLAMSTFVALLIDVILYKNNLNGVTLSGSFLLVLSGFLLPTNKNKQSEDVKLGFTLLLLLFLSIAGAVQFAAYKNALMIQSNPFLHTMFAQGVVYIIFLAICFKSLKKDIIDKKIKINDFIFFGILIYIFTVIEAYLFKELPITILIPLSVLNIIIYQIFDVRKNAIKNSWQLYLATFTSIVAIVIINLK